MIGGRILDTTALTDYATHRIYARALIGVALRSGAMVMAVPAAALMAARTRLPERGRAELAELAAMSPIIVDELSKDTARRAGDLMARARTPPDGEPLDAGHVAFTARVRGWPVVTAEPERLLALDAALDIERLP